MMGRRVQIDGAVPLPRNYRIVLSSALIKDIPASFSLTCAVQQLRDFPRAGASGSCRDHGEETTGRRIRVGASRRPLCPGAGRRAQAGGHVLHNEGT